MKIALTNLDQIWESPQENFELCEKTAVEAAKNGCKLIIFPEMTLTGFTSKFREFSEDIENSNSISRFQDLAKRLQINIVFGALLKSDKKYRNTAITVASANVVNGSLLTTDFDTTTAVASGGVPVVTVSASSATGGKNGDIWIVV